MAAKMTAFMEAVNFFQPSRCLFTEIPKAGEVIGEHGADRAGEEQGQGNRCEGRGTDEDEKHDPGDHLIGDRHRKQAREPGFSVRGGVNPVADPGVPVGNGIKSQVAENRGGEDGDLPSGNDFRQRQSADDVDGGKQGGLAGGFGQGADEGTNPRGINFPGPFERRADDEAGGLGQEFRKVGQGGAAADEERGSGGGGVGPAKMIRIRAVAGAGPAENEGIRPAAFPSVACLVLDGVAGGDRGGMFHIHIGKDPDAVGSDSFAEAEKFLGDPVQDSLVGHAGSDQDIDADKVSPRGGRHGHGADAIVAEEVDTQRAGKEFARLASQGSEAGDRGRPGGIRGKGGIPKVFQDDRMGPAFFQRHKIPPHGFPDGIQLSGIAGCAWQGGEVDHTEKST